VIVLLSLLAAAAENAPLYWVDLGLRNYLFRIGSFELRWYSLAYLAGIILAYWHLSRMIKAPGAPMAQRHVDDLFFYCTLGVIIGGRLGYAAFYAPELFAQPFELLKLWNGGMSFHGGLIGTVAAIAWIAWRAELSFLRVCDYVAVCVPFGLLFGRLANFVNGELWGRIADVPWAFIFPHAGPEPRHPSQLYQAGLEGLLLFLVLLFAVRSGALKRPGMVGGLFVAGYGVARMIGELFREPDAHIGFLAGGLTMGMLLSIPMLVAGGIAIVFAARRPARA
jgi:phosphatidylglycerol---prolipoprotein diacylglyceryl transferase